MRGSIHMKFSMTGQERGDVIIQMTTCAGLTITFQIDKKITWHVVNNSAMGV